MHHERKQLEKHLYKAMHIFKEKKKLPKSQLLDEEFLFSLYAATMERNDIDDIFLKWYLYNRARHKC